MNGIGGALCLLPGAVLHGIGELVFSGAVVPDVAGVRVDARVTGWQVRGLALLRGDDLWSAMIKGVEA